MKTRRRGIDPRPYDLTAKWMRPKTKQPKEKDCSFCLGKRLVRDIAADIYGGARWVRCPQCSGAR